jgi:IS1 family transposase
VTGYCHERGGSRVIWLGAREHKNPDKLMEMGKPLKIGKAYTDNSAYYERFPSEVLVVTKKTRKRQKGNVCR